MQLKDVLEKNAFPLPFIERITSSGIKELFPPQADAIKKGVLTGKSLLLSVPTAAGKTLIAELCMLRSIFAHQGQGQGRCLYIAPLKALASEKFNDFKDKYKDLGVEVGLAIGDIDSPSKYLKNYHIIVATAEKVDSLLRTKSQWLIDSLTVVVLDEIHFINDGARGPTLEILTARIKQLNPGIQFLALSATVKNAQEMAEWLGAALVQSTWRPIPLNEGVYVNGKIQFSEGPTRVILEDAADDVSKLALDTLRGKGQVLVFVNSRRSAQAVSHQVCAAVDSLLTPEERQRLKTLAQKIIGPASDATKICHKLAHAVKHGAAFHHAGLKPQQRHLIEENFKKNLIKVIGCTPTLAAGVNLPARRAIIRDSKRFERGLGQAYIPVSEYKQCAGRAGRPQYDDYGEAILIAKTPNEADALIDKYILAGPEPVISKLADESALRVHILASIAGGYVHDVRGMFDFISHTFLYHQKPDADLLHTIGNIFEFLHEGEFIEKSGYRFFPTPLGSLTSRLYIDPLTTLLLRRGLSKITSQEASVVGLLHLISCCPDGPRLSVGTKDMEMIETFASRHADDFLVHEKDLRHTQDYYGHLASLKTTFLLLHWLEEEKEDVICDRFNLGPGDVYRHVEATQWLLHAIGQLAHLSRKKSLTFSVERLKERVRYGIKEELLSLVQLKGVGRVRARILFEEGFKNLAALKTASPQKLAKIKNIGTVLAEDILTQLSSLTAK